MNEELQRWLGGPSEGGVIERRLTTLSRHGHPLLHLPRKRMLAVQALDLYPAQRPAARLARDLFRWIHRLGLHPALPARVCPVSTESQAARFLTGLLAQDDLPEFAVLEGNPHAPGRRYILLLFDAGDRPAMIVKVGCNQAACALVVREAEMLTALAGRAVGVPRVLAVHRSGMHGAVALEYVGGHAPRSAAPSQLAAVLGAWMDSTRGIRADSVPAWERLVRICPDEVVLRPIRHRIESATFHPVVYHGDFAPWNVKVQPDRTWRVLDWERGELMGMPCWDWFHYQVQVALLVGRLSTGAHARHVERWLAGSELKRYAARAGVEAVVRELFLAYLLYSMHVIGPKESLPVKEDLLNTLAAAWKSA